MVYNVAICMRMWQMLQITSGFVSWTVLARTQIQKTELSVKCYLGPSEYVTVIGNSL